MLSSEQQKNIIEEEEIERVIRLNKLPPSLYHYTSFAAFFGMIENKELWLGNASFMNDRREMEDFIDRLKKQVMKACSSSESETEKVKDLFSSLEISYPYIMSFSEYDDDASLWERYTGDAKGVNIEFDTRAFIRCFWTSGGTLNKVSYNYPTEKHQIYTKILEYIKNNDIKNYSKSYIQDQILLQANIKKNKCFASENEIRFATMWDKTLDNSKKEFKLSGEYIKEYMILKLEDYFKERNMGFIDLFKSIKIGPLSKEPVIVIKNYLNSKNYNKLADVVTESKCPLR